MATISTTTRQGLDDLPGRLRGMFTSHDWDHDGKLTREEWDEAVKLLGSSKNSAFALKLGGSGDVTESHVALEAEERSALRSLGPGLPRAVHPGERRRRGHDLRRGIGQADLSEATAASGRYYASPVAANGYIYFTSLDDGVITVMKIGG